jgi:hypothetical protein
MKSAVEPFCVANGKHAGAHVEDGAMLVWIHPPVASGGCRGTGAEHRFARRRARRANAWSHARAIARDERCAGAERCAAIHSQPDASARHRDQPQSC